jgi:hypothetical protein
VFPALKTVLKRGALVAAANWPVVFIQALTDSLFKLLVAVPVLGGIVLVTAIVGADPGALVALSWNELVPTLLAALGSRPLVLLSFLLALGVVVVGGSLLVFLVKGGTVATLAQGDRQAGPLERPPLRFEAVATAAAFSLESFIDGARRLFPRYARLGLVLIAIYVGAGGLYIAAVFLSPADDRWLVTALATVLFVCGITVVNLLYLLTQVVMAADELGPGQALGRVLRLLRYEHWQILAVFGVVLALFVFATGASILATALLGMIAFVPFFGLTVLPLQLLAWLLRSLVFEYIALTSIGAYIRVYRAHASTLASREAHVEVRAPHYGSAVEGR